MALFRQQVSGTRRLRGDNRRVVERPKPPPLPRPRASDDDATVPAPARPAAGSDQDLFAQAMAGVSPLLGEARARLLPRSRYLGVATPPAAQPIDRPPDPCAPPEAWLEWAHAGATPLRSADRAEVDRPRPPPLPLQRERDEASVLQESIDTPLSFDDRLDIGDEAVFLRSGIPRRVLSDLRRGRWVVQRELDLHGMTRDEARLGLAAFLAKCLVEGKRCVRLIHGKGLGSPGGVGILKQLSRGWLAQREEILAFCQARPHEGGSGALLILLRANSARPGGAR